MKDKLTKNMASRNENRPNILFILSDDQGAWTLGAGGNKEIKTPNLDKLSKEGVRFSNFFCTSPVCSPARASILTGRIPSQHGVHDWIASGNIDFNNLDEELKKNQELQAEVKPIQFLKDQISYTDLLCEAGYDCMLSGKWHLGDSITPQKGFSHWFTIARGGCHYYNGDIVRDGKVQMEERFITDVITEDALQCIEYSNEEEKPFYLSVHYTAPHSPWDKEENPEEIYKLYEDCAFESVPNEALHPWQNWDIWKPKSEKQSIEQRRKELIRGYYSSITAMDRGIGKIVEKLEALNLRENTLIIFTSDNGMSMGHHGVWGKGNGTFPLNMYDSAVKVPAIISRPGFVPQGKVCEELVSHYDLMPTLLDYVEVKNPEGNKLPGKSFGEILRGESLNEEEKEIVIFDEYGPVRMIRTKDWKYVHRYPYGPHELYDLVKDPEEKMNLIACEENTLILEKLRGKLENWFVRYTNPMLDGRQEAVTGNGQINLAGPRISGSKAFN